MWLRHYHTAAHSRRACAAYWSACKTFISVAPAKKEKGAVPKWSNKGIGKQSLYICRRNISSQRLSKHVPWSLWVVKPVIFYKWAFAVVRSK
jgi:hypothetical protein